LGKLRHSSGGHFAYLMGERSLRGWWYYFPAAIALKTPIPFLAAFWLSLVLLPGVRAKGAGFKNVGTGYVFLLLPMVWYVFAMASTGVNIGVRHVLFFYPVAAVVGSALLARSFRRKGFFLVVLVLGGAWHMTGTIAVHPHYLAYFNGVAGGPMGGPRYLIDSNIDWGQDERVLAEFVFEEPDTVLVNPGAFAPSVGTIAVNVNSLKGILRGDDSAYAWLAQFEPEKTLGYTWYVYRLGADDYRRAVEESGSNPEARFWYAIALRKEGRLKEALAELRSIAADRPDLQARSSLNSGRMLVQAGSYGEGIEDLRKAAEIGGGRGAQTALEAAVIEDKWSRGEATADELLWLGEHRAEGGNLLRAREALVAGMDVAPEHSRLHLAMARLFGREGRFEEAAEHARDAVDLAPGSAEARRIRDEAERLAAMQKSRDSLEAMMTLAGLDSRYGRPAAAARRYWHAFNLYPSSQEALTAMGEIVVRAKLGALKLETGWPSWESK
jgi:tetratricopeptide (TPR) repeat protein